MSDILTGNFRESNRLRVLRHPARSRADVRRRLGLSRATLTTVLSELERAAWSSSSAGAIGRPPLQVSLAPSAADPSLVIVGGELAEAGDLVLDAIRGAIAVRRPTRRGRGPRRHGRAGHRGVDPACASAPGRRRTARRLSLLRGIADRELAPCSA
jgi:hypothetical protein